MSRSETGSPAQALQNSGREVRLEALRSTAALFGVDYLDSDEPLSGTPPCERPELPLDFFF